MPRKTQRIATLAWYNFLPTYYSVSFSKSILFHIIARNIRTNCTNAVKRVQKVIPSLQKKLFNYIDEHLTLYLNELEQLNISEQLQTHAKERQDRILEYLQKQGIRTQLLGSDPPLIYAEPNTGGSKTLLLYSHLNFESRDAKDPVYAVPVCACLAAIDAYQHVVGTLPVTVKCLICAGKEETGNPHLTDVIEQHRNLLQADGCLLISNLVTEDVDGSRPVLLLGTRGFLSVEMEARTSDLDLDSRDGTIVPNAAWRLTWALGCIKDAREEILIEGFYDTIAPLEDEEIALLHNLPDRSGMLAQQRGMEQLLMGLHGFQLNYTRLLVPTCTITSIHSGSTAENPPAMIPGKARAFLDFYLVPDQDPWDIFSKLQRHLQEYDFQDIQVRMLNGSRPARTPTNAPFVEAVRRATAAAYGSVPFILPMGSESNSIETFRRILDLPVVSTTTGFSELDEDTRKCVFAASIKQLATIFEEMYGNAINTTA